MQVQVPGEYRQSARWILNLDAGSLALLIGGAALAFEVFRAAGPLAPRIVEALLIAGVAVTLAVVRWPLDQGDRALTWIWRAIKFYRRPRRGSAWGKP